MTTPYPSDMQRYVDICTRQELYDLLRFHLAQRFIQIPGGVTIPAALSRLKVDAIRELIVKLRIPCTRDTVRLSWLIKDTRSDPGLVGNRDQFYEAFARYRREAEKLQLPPTPPKPPTELELANEELAKAKKKWEDRKQVVRRSDAEISSYCKKIAERRAMIEQMRRKIREYEDVVAGSEDYLKKMQNELKVAKGMSHAAWWEWTNAAEKVDKLDTVVETCSVCMDDKKSSQLVKTDCKHPLCTECFTSMREHAAPGTMAAPRSVPCPLCRAPISA
jgi:hypothetical protein